jgi:glycosyltransferase involved in cell wall biosynthesis
MDVTVAICTWNRAELLRQTLESLTRLAIPDWVAWSVMVVNNNSTDHTDAVAREFLDRLPLTIVLESRPGLPLARNTALDRASGDLVIYIDDDVLVDPQWLRHFAEAARRHPGAVAFGGPIEPWFPETPDPLLAEAFPNLKNGFCGLDHGSQEIVLEISQEIFGANMAFSKSAMGEARFDPQVGHAHGLMMLGDETILLRRLQSQGKQVIWVPGMRLKHYVDPKRMRLPYLLTYYGGVGRGHVRVYGTNGVNGHHADREPATWHGVPRWVIRSRAQSRFRAMLARLRRRRLDELIALREHAYYAGMFDEYRRMAQGARK